TATAQQRVLRTQTAMREFKGRARVVIEAANQAMIPMIRNTACIKRRAYCRKVRRRCFVERICDAGESVDDRLILRHLAIEHAQRIRLRASLAVNTHLSDNGL